MTHNPMSLAMLKPPPDLVNESGVKWWALDGVKGGYHPFLVELPDGQRYYVVLADLDGRQPAAVVHETQQLDALFSWIEMRVLADRLYPDDGEVSP